MRLFCVLLFFLPLPLFAATAGQSGADDLSIAAGGRTSAVVVVSPTAGTWEKRAATDLVTYIERMSGAKPSLADTQPAIDAALKQPGPQFFVGSIALDQQPAL